MNINIYIHHLSDRNIQHEALTISGSSETSSAVPTCEGFGPLSRRFTELMRRLGHDVQTFAASSTFLVFFICEIILVKFILIVLQICHDDQTSFILETKCIMLAT